MRHAAPGRSLVCTGGDDRLPRPVRQPPADQDDKGDEQEIATAPQPALPVDRQQRLDQQGIGEQPGEAAEVRCSIKPVRILRRPGGGEPALQQRRLRRNGDEQRPDRGGEQPRHPQFRRHARRQRPAQHANRQPQGRECQQAEVHHRLRADPQPAERMGIAIAREQQRLVHQHRRIPHRRGAAEPRQGDARHHRLDEEQQKRSGEDRHDEQGPAGANGHAAGRSIV